MLLAITFSTHAQANLQPYTATYSANYSGLSMELNRELKKTGADQWSLSNESSLLFATLEEKAAFQIRQNKLVPMRYQYDNPMSSKRNSNLSFDWDKNVVKDSERDKPPLKLPADALDKLTFQLQLRMDLMANAKQLVDKTYTLVDSTQLKSYTVDYLGEETVSTPNGTFSAVKIKQQRPGKDKHTIIWFAKDWHYLIIKIERFEKGESRYKLELESATINGTKMAAKTNTQ